VDDIAGHRCISYRLASGRVQEWEFRVGGVSRTMLPKAACTFNDADLVLQAVLNGEGLAQLAGYQVCELLRSGQLVAVLPQYAPDDRGHYLCYLNRRHLPTRTRVFIDYITLQIRALDLYCIGNFSLP
jgi:DNA-binding transcriptional LysR family regulator